MIQNNLLNVKPLYTVKFLYSQVGFMWSRVGPETAMFNYMFREVNSLILKQASKLTYSVRDVAPNTFKDLKASPSLVIWSGASDNTIFQDKRVNWAFRALHDALHLKTGLGFSPESEIELGRIQASQYSGFMADLVYIETAGQAEHYLKTGRFVLDQVSFTINALVKLGYKI